MYHHTTRAATVGSVDVRKIPLWAGDLAQVQRYPQHTLLQSVLLLGKRSLARLIQSRQQNHNNSGLRAWPSPPRPPHPHPPQLWTFTPNIHAVHARRTAPLQPPLWLCCCRRARPCPASRTLGPAGSRVVFLSRRSIHIHRSSGPTVLFLFTTTLRAADAFTPRRVRLLALLSRGCTSSAPPSGSQGLPLSPFH